MSEAFAQAGGMFTAASAIFKTLKEGANAIHEAKNLELYERMLAVYGDVVELVEKNRELSENNRILHEQLALTKSMIHRPPFFYQENDPTPYCPACWEGGKKAVHVAFIFENDERTRWDCPVCKQHYLIEKGQPRAPRGYSGPSGPDGWLVR